MNSCSFQAMIINRACRLSPAQNIFGSGMSQVLSGFPQPAKRLPHAAIGLTELADAEYELAIDIVNGKIENQALYAAHYMSLSTSGILMGLTDSAITLMYLRGLLLVAAAGLFFISYYCWRPKDEP